MNKLLGICSLLAILINPNSLLSETLIGPFSPETSHYTIIPGGDFEAGNLNGWTQFANTTGGGFFRASSEWPFMGQYSAFWDFGDLYHLSKDSPLCLRILSSIVILLSKRKDSCEENCRDPVVASAIPASI
jgi:hypothetical protein